MIPILDKVPESTQNLHDGQQTKIHDNKDPSGDALDVHVK